MSNTEKFLKEAFAGESQANRKYSSFAAKADKEGFAQQPSCSGRRLKRRGSRRKSPEGS